MASERLLDGTVIVGIHGSMRRFEWMDKDPLQSDLYGIFIDRALVMNWSSTGWGGMSADLWEMNEAGRGHGEVPGLLGWVQVGLTDRSGGGPLPLTPLIANAWEATARFGSISVTAVQVLTPLHLTGSASKQLRAAGSWFAAADPAHTVNVRIDLDTGDDPAAVEQYAVILERIADLQPDQFVVSGRDPRPAAAAVSESPVFGDLRLGATRNRVSFAAKIPEWTVEAIGWTILIIAEGARAAGVATSASIVVALEI